ncbi:MAG: chromosome segregation protein [Opitutia bacterium Tous-C1TDCM]|nr:MAG: chromosome segregation protein [Opitutae bacterium Tous-C1TDCM]
MLSLIPRARRAGVYLAVGFAGLAPASAAEAIDFNRDIRPILSDACYHCHGPDAATREAKLRLDEREGLFRTKDDVTVVVPGKPEASELIQRIISPHADEVMPPPEATRQLKPAEKELLKRWIAGGAPWGRHWAFLPPVRPAVPAVADRAVARRVRNPIDAFIFARLAQEKLAPAPEADAAALLRRVALDLTGLPPTPAETAAFVADRAPDAYERAVDRLLASPRYGERWAWDWLDLARYADTNGFQGDPERTMWPWRDWVVNALNANMPFDQFTIEQLAGDLLPGATRDQKIASGFHRNNMFNGEGGRIPEETRVENVFDRVETTATVWLGATFSCARCHDHKYDPITQKDYFAMYDIFNQMSETGRLGGGGQVLPILDVSTPEELAAVKTATARVDTVAKAVEAYERKKFPRPEGKPMSESPDALKLPGNLPAVLAKVEPKRRGVDALLEAVPYFRDTAPDPEYAALLQASLDAVRARNNANSRITKVMIMDELPELRETFILNKGNYEAKTDVKVVGAIPAVFQTAAAGAPPAARVNRLGLARWLVSPENPLAARTAVNRAWQAFFGTGFVKTAEDFGVQGEPPSHPELLDWLATEYTARGWDTKALHRLIVTSATYRQASRTNPALQERDPENRLLARGPRHRLPSWMIRDQALAAAGLLVEPPGGPAVKPYQPAGIWEEATFGKKTYQQDHGEALYRRSLYVFWRRIVGPTTFFDAGARQVCTVKIARTNTPLHALVTLNDPAYVEAARVLAQRVLAAGGDDRAKLGAAFQFATTRGPRANEAAILHSRLGKLRAQFAADPAAAKALAAAGEAPRPAELDSVEHAAWTALCSLILNLDETLSKE